MQHRKIGREHRRYRLLAGAVTTLSACLLILAPPGRAAAVAVALGAARGGGQVPVVSCPAPTYSGVKGPPVPPIPATMYYPWALPLPAGSQVYGIGLPGLGAYYLLAPTGFACEHAEIGTDGTTFVELVDRADHNYSVGMMVYAGGVLSRYELACAYIPAVQAADAAAEGPSFDPLTCTAPPGVAVTQLPVGRPGLYAAAIRVPRTLTRSAAEPEWGTVFAPLVLPWSDGNDTPVALLTTQISQAGAEAQEIDCSLPPSQLDICTASLQFFLATQSDLGQHLSLPSLTAAVAQVAGFIDTRDDSVAESSPGTEKPDCRAVMDTGLDRKIDSLASRRIPIPWATVNLPVNLEGAVDVTASIGNVSICRSAVYALLKDFSPVGNLAIAASTHYRQTLGPFVYSLRSTTWTSAPGAPPGQDFVTRFSPVGVTADINPHLSLDQSGLSLTVASVELHAIQSQVTLVRQQSGPLLQASVGPTLVLSAAIQKNAVEEAVEEGEMGGLDEQTAIDDTSEELSSDIAVGFESDAAAFFGIDISSQMISVYARVDFAFVGALDADPVLASVTTSTADVAEPAVPDTAMTADDADAADLVSGETVDVSPLAEILDLLLF